MKFKITKAEAGFSLIELMIVVGIIGILATIAVPRMQNFRSRAMQAEHNMILNNIATLQAAFQLENNGYTSYAAATDWYGRDPAGAAGSACAPANPILLVNQGLGFQIEPCVNGRSPRYAYNIFPATPATFTATANSGAGNNNLIFPGCGAEIRTIDQNRIMNPAQAVAACPPP